MPWHKKDFSDLVLGTKNESLGYFENQIFFNFLKENLC